MFFKRSSKLAQFTPDSDIPYEEILKQTKVLIIGAGGLGCEMLKAAPFAGFEDIEIIDMDTIDVSNLNRQFLFRSKDVGKFKSSTAASFINDKLKLDIKAHCCRIEEKDADWYSQFQIILVGLDSVEARRWINRMVQELYQDRGLVIPLIDGGTEALKGQVRVMIPSQTACYECTLAMNNSERKAYPICTIANTPRLPEHCIEWASVIEWERLKKGTLDADNSEHMQWIFKVALQRAELFGIAGVTYQLCGQVLKNIIPAIASTNALIGAAVVNEALKIVTGVGKPLALDEAADDFVLTVGDSPESGVYSFGVRCDRLEDCPVCQVSPSLSLSVDGTLTLEQFIAEVKDLVAKQMSVTLSNPSLRVEGTTLYMSSLHDQLKSNLSKTLNELIKERNFELTVTDKSLAKHVTVNVQL